MCSSTPLGGLLLPQHLLGAPEYWRCSAELQVLVNGDVELELVGLEEVVQLLHIALVHLVHLLL
jgi:hypothetical protein